MHFEQSSVQGRVILRPVNLVKVKILLQNKDWRSKQRRKAMAQQLAFGGQRTCRK